MGKSMVSCEDFPFNHWQQAPLIGCRRSPGSHGKPRPRSVRNVTTCTSDVGWICWCLCQVVWTHEGLYAFYYIAIIMYLYISTCTYVYIYIYINIYLYIYIYTGWCFERFFFACSTLVTLCGMTIPNDEQFLQRGGSTGLWGTMMIPSHLNLPTSWSSRSRVHLQDSDKVVPSYELA